MAVDTTLLLNEVDAIVSSGTGVRHITATCRLKTPVEWLEPVNIELLSLERDYEDGFGDVFVVNLVFGMGQYAYKLLPYRDNLFVDLTITPQYHESDSAPNTKSVVKRYRAIVMDQDNPGLVGRSPQSSSESDMDLSGLKTVQMQLIEEGLYQIRMATVGRVYRQVTPMTALKSLLTETTRLVDSNNQQQIFGVDTVPGYNEQVRRQIVIPHGTLLTETPDLFQQKEGGIYGAGLSCYLQDGYWRVFPSYDTERWKKTPKALTIISVPPNRFYGAEKTFRYTSNQVILITAGSRQVEDVGLYEQLNEGNALRFMDANRLLTAAETTDNRTLLKRKENLYEFEAARLESGVNNARWTAERATSNPFKHYSEVAQRNGRYMAVQWLYGDSTLLYPGMPVKYMAATNNQLGVYHGVLLGVHDQRARLRAGVGNSAFGSTLMLKVFLSRLGTPV